MSDSFTPATPEPSAPAATEPNPGQSVEAPGGAEPTTPGVHPAWDKALSGIPDAWQAPIREQIQRSDAEAKAAIEKARQESTPQEWRELVDQAQQLNLTPDEFIDAYNGRLDMQQRIQNDPDGFLQELNEFIDEQVKAGAITRRQAQQQKADAAAEIAGGDPVFEDEQAKQLRLMQERLDKQDAEREAERQRQLEEQQAAQQEQAAAAYADTFMNEFDRQTVEAGFNVVENGVLKPVLPLPLQQQLAYAADALLDGNPNMQPSEAIKRAVENFRAAAAQQGWQLPGAQTNRPNIPVIGGGSSTPPPANAPQQLPAGSEGRNAAAVAAMKEMLGQA